MGVHEEFAGVIGRDWRTSTPAWPARPEPPDGAPNVVVIVLDDVGFAQLGCYGSDIDTPNIDGLADQGVRLANFHTTALCSPTRSCLLTGRNHHTNGMGRVADLAIGLPGLRRASCRRRTASSPRSCARTATPRTRSASGTSRPTTRRTWPPTGARGRSVAASSAGTGSTAARRTSSCRRSYRDNHSVQPPRTPAEGYHLTEDLVDHAIEYLGDLRHVDADAAVLPLLRHRRVPLAAPRAAGVDRALPRRVRRRVGRLARAHRSPASWSSESCPPTSSCRRARTGCRRGTSSSPTTSAVAARFMECFAGFLSHTDDQIGRAARRTSTRRGDADNTIVVLVSDNGASSEGGVDRLDQRRPALERRPRGPRGAARPHRRDRRAVAPQQLPVGLDDGRQHAVPAVEARGARGRRGRPAASSAGQRGIAARGEIRRQFAHADRRPADRARR